MTGSCSLNPGASELVLNSTLTLYYYHTLTLASMEEAAAVAMDYINSEHLSSHFPYVDGGKVLI